MVTMISKISTWIALPFVLVSCLLPFLFIERTHVYFSDNVVLQQLPIIVLFGLLLSSISLGLAVKQNDQRTKHFALVLLIIQLIVLATFFIQIVIFSQSLYVIRW